MIKGGHGLTDIGVHLTMHLVHPNALYNVTTTDVCVQVCEFR